MELGTFVFSVKFRQISYNNKEDFNFNIIHLVKNLSKTQLNSEVFTIIWTKNWSLALVDFYNQKGKTSHGPPLYLLQKLQYYLCFLCITHHLSRVINHLTPDQIKMPQSLWKRYGRWCTVNQRFLNFSKSWSHIFLGIHHSRSVGTGTPCYKKLSHLCINQKKKRILEQFQYRKFIACLWCYSIINTPQITCYYNHCFFNLYWKNTQNLLVICCRRPQKKIYQTQSIRKLRFRQITYTYKYPCRVAFSYTNSNSWENRLLEIRPFSISDLCLPQLDFHKHSPYTSHCNRALTTQTILWCWSERSRGDQTISPARSQWQGRCLQFPSSSSF
jgi:hypothetical protein